ncbi:hypothetical protein CDL12_11969 [Handroanthus impetiginosus]|uniref:Symplekin/Pta1 N-terminal domain-containing protein n=1 Tax=Handroanthus impetiginosus TaxID=429701 RepID=A0A2G9HCZ5_9LAMI|nr:hypothetical protein CDL12_11969 [Handroanthus impetiginosus]
MVKFRDAVSGMIFEAAPVGPKMLAIKFLETYVLHFTLVSSDTETFVQEVRRRPRRVFNVSWIVDGHPVLDIPTLVSDANRYLGILLDILQSASTFPGLLTVSAVNSLAAIARKRPVYFKSVLAALLDFNPNFEMANGSHADSIQHSLRTAFLGFLRCTHPVIGESRERLLKALRAMNAGDAADQVIRQIDKIMRNNEHALWHISGDLTKKRSAPLESEDQSNSVGASSKRLHYDPYNNTTGTVDAEQDQVNGRSPMLPVLDGDPTPVEQMIAMIAALVAEGEKGLHSLGILISNIHADLLADIVIANMKHLPKNPPPITKFNNMSLRSPSDSCSGPAELVAANGSATSTQSLGLAAQIPPLLANTTSLALSDMSSYANLSIDSKRDPRRDSRRLDPRRMVVSLDVPVTSVAEDNACSVQYGPVQSDFDASCSSSTPVLPLPVSSSESILVHPMPKIETDSFASEPRIASEADKLVSENEVKDAGP